MKSILFLVTALFLAINVNAQTQREFLGYNGARIDHNWIWQGLNFDSETMTASVRVWHRTVGSHTGSGFYGGDIAIIGIVVPREIENPANGQMYTVTRWVRGGQIGRDRHFVVNQQIAAHVESFMNFHVFIPNTIEVIEGEHADFNSVFRRGRVVNNNWVVTHATDPIGFFHFHWECPYMYEYSIAYKISERRLEGWQNAFDNLSEGAQAVRERFGSRWFMGQHLNHHRYESNARWCGVLNCSGVVNGIRYALQCNACRNLNNFNIVTENSIMIRWGSTFMHAAYIHAHYDIRIFRDAERTQMVDSIGFRREIRVLAERFAFSYTFTGLDSNTEYFYVIRSRPSYSSGSRFSTVSINSFTTLEKNVHTPTPTENSVLIEWEAVDGAESYLLKLFSNAERTNEIARYEINSNNLNALGIRNSGGVMLSHQVTGLDSNTEFWYSITAFGTNNEAINTIVGSFQTLESGVSTPTITTNNVKFWVANGIVHFNKNVDNVSLIDMQGRMLLSAENVSELNVSNLKGMFVLRINNQNVKVMI